MPSNLVNYAIKKKISKHVIPLCYYEVAAISVVLIDKTAEFDVPFDVSAAVFDTFFVDELSDRRADL